MNIYYILTDRVSPLNLKLRQNWIIDKVKYENNQEKNGCHKFHQSEYNLALKPNM